MHSRFEQKLIPGGKLPLRISSQTMRVLSNDITCFSDYETPISLSKLIAVILNQFADEAACSVYRRCEASSLKAGSDAWAKMQQNLCNKAAALLSRARKSHPISLNAALCEFSARDDVARESYIEYKWSSTERKKAHITPKTPSKSFLYEDFQDYVAALLEEYAELSYSRREQIFFRDICVCLKDAEQHGKALHLYRKDGSFRFWPRPDGALLSDALLPYNYLVGYRTKEKPDGSLMWQSRQPVSFRLSEIRGLSEAGSSDLTSIEAARLENAIANYGVAYLFGENAWTLVCFSPLGANDFHKRLINRPAGKRLSAIEELLPDFPAGSEIWRLEDRKWKINIYLRTFGKTVYRFSLQELTPAVWDILVKDAIQMHCVGKKKALCQQSDVEAVTSANLEQAFMSELPNDTSDWYQSALDSTKSWPVWVKNALPQK